MKNKNRISTHYLFTMLLSLFVFAFAGCTDDEVVYDHLGVSGDSYTFDGDGTQTYKIDIQSLAEWSYTIEGDWVTEVAKDATSLTIGAKANDIIGERSGKIIFTAGAYTQTVKLLQLPYGAASARYCPIDDFTPAAMSPSGTYIGGVITSIEADDSYGYTPVIIEVATGKRTLLEKTAESIGARAITDQGMLLCLVGGYTSIIYKMDGTSFLPAVPSGFNLATVEAVSADGSVMVGYAQGEGTYSYSALKWTDPEGIPEVLESPKFNNWGVELQNGVMARGCSADGSIVYGSEWETFRPVYWTADGTLHLVGEDVFLKESGIMFDPWTGEEVEAEFVSAPSLTAMVNNMSPNGKYLACEFKHTQLINKNPVTKTYAMIFDTEADKSTIVWEHEDASGLTVLNDGTVSIGTPAAGTMTGIMYNPTFKTSLPTSAWMKQKFNLIVGGDLPIEKVSVGETTALCWRPQISMFGVTYMYSYLVK